MDNIKKLPDCYLKTEESNNYKLLNLNELAISDLKADMQACLNSLDLQQATGKTLDLYGAMLDEKRGNLNDEQYRVVLSAKLIANASKGTVKDVTEKICTIYNCNPVDISFSDGKNSGEVKISKFPLKIINKSEFSLDRTFELLQSFMPIGVIITETNLEGTFEFGDIVINSITYDALEKCTYSELETKLYNQLDISLCEYDENTGFADVEQTIGGYLGLITKGG